MNIAQCENVTLSGLYVYPIKSCAGISLESAELGATGLRHDRRWMLVDETGEFMSQRAHPRMALISTRLSDGHLIVSAPGMPDLEIPLHQENGDSIDVRVWGDTNRGALVGKEADRWFGEFLTFPCRLVHKPDDDPRLVDSSFAESGDQVGFADGFAFLLISEASLEDLNDRLEDPLPMNRFRPNFVVRGCEPYAEDGWSRLRIGDVPFRVAEACPRCAITTVDQETGTRGKEPLRTLATYRKFDGEVFFGRNLHPRRARYRARRRPRRGHAALNGVRRSFLWISLWRGPGEEVWLDVAAADHGDGEARVGQFFSVEQVGGERHGPARLCDEPDAQRQAAHGLQDLLSVTVTMSSTKARICSKGASPSFCTRRPSATVRAT